jgi:hypothetical protein
MSRMMIVAIRHDKLDLVEKLDKSDFDISQTDYANPILERVGVISTGHHHSRDADNILLTENGSRYINSSREDKIHAEIADEVEKYSGVVLGAEGLDIARKEILKAKELMYAKTPIDIVESGKVSLFYINNDLFSEMKDSMFKDMVSFIRKNEEIIDDNTLAVGNYNSTPGISIESQGEGFRFNDEAPKYVGTLNDNVMAMVHLEKGIVTTFALPNVKIDLTHNMLEKELGRELRVAEKKERKLRMSH